MRTYALLFGCLCVLGCHPPGQPLGAPDAESQMPVYVELMKRQGVPLRQDLHEHHGRRVAWVDFSKATHFSWARFGSETITIIEHPVNWLDRLHEGTFAGARSSRLTFQGVYHVSGRGPASIWHANKLLCRVGGPCYWTLAGHSVGTSILFTVRDHIGNLGPLAIDFTSTASRRTAGGDLTRAWGSVWLDSACTGKRFVCSITEDADQSVPRVVDFLEAGKFDTKKVEVLRLDPKGGDYVPLAESAFR